MAVFIMFIARPRQTGLGAGLNRLYVGMKFVGSIAGMANRKDSGKAEETVKRRVREAGERALAEVEARRAAAAHALAPGRELDGRGGKDPVRYGDWEAKGRAVDF
jgi:hypothetical protein